MMWSKVQYEWRPPGRFRKAFKESKERVHQVKMSPLNCAFRVSVGNLLTFLVYKRGIKIDKNKAKAIIEAKAPSNKTDLQRFMGQINFLRWFQILQIKWRHSHHISDSKKTKSSSGMKIGFDEINMYLTKLQVLIPSQLWRPLKLYV